MITQQSVSITELKKDTSRVIKSLKTEGSKIIFINNKPVAVLSDIDQFDLHVDEPFSFYFGEEGVDPQDILDAIKAGEDGTKVC